MNEPCMQRYFLSRMPGLSIVASLAILFGIGLFHYSKFPVEKSLPPEKYFENIGQTARTLGFIKLSAAAALAVDIERYREETGNYPVSLEWTVCTSKAEELEIYTQWKSLAGNLCLDVLTSMGPEGGTLLYRGGRKNYRLMVKDAILKPAVQSVYPELGRTGVYWGYGFKSF